MAQRSEPGKGSIVGIYLAQPAGEWLDSVVGMYNKTELCGSVGEDYAECGWPVVVKVKARVTKEELVQCLRDLTDAIEDGHYTDVPETLPELPEFMGSFWSIDGFNPGRNNAEE